MPYFLMPFKNIILEKFTGMKGKLSPVQEFLLNSSVGMLTLHEGVSEHVTGDIRPFKFDMSKEFQVVPNKASKSNIFFFTFVIEWG